MNNGTGHLHQSVLEFRALKAGEKNPNVGWFMDTCAVTAGEPFGDKISGPGVEVRDDFKIVMHGGLHLSSPPAEAFLAGLTAQNMMRTGAPSVRMTPDSLYSAFAGTLTLALGGQTFSFSDFRLGAGKAWYSRSVWWIGSAACERLQGSNSLRCRSQEDRYIQFQVPGTVSSVDSDYFLVESRTNPSA